MSPLPASSARETSGGLRVLLTINTPWLRHLGAPQAMMELGEALARAGHQVEKFSHEDAFPGGPERGPVARVRRALGFRPRFSDRLAKYLRANSHRFDVVDANQTDLPFPKAAFSFSNLLVCRSVGLIERYLENEIWTRGRWPNRGSLRHRLADARALAAMRRAAGAARASLRSADLLNLSNRDDVEYLADRGWDRSRMAVFPLGLTAGRRAALARGSVDRTHTAERTVAFIGTWNYRKGAGDWPELVRRVRTARPETRFLFLGVGIPASRVLERFAPVDRPAIRALESYSFEELPVLLAAADVGAFPGYLEGFGIGVLEMLASGLPVAAYDAPGPRDILRGCPAALLGPPGDLARLEAGLLDWLQLPRETLGELSRAASAWSAHFDWDTIAAETIVEYRQRLDRLRSAG